MARLLLRSGKDPFRAVAPEAVLAQRLLNSNVGNALFQQAVQRSLSRRGTEIVSNGTLAERAPATRAQAARVDEHFDAFVVPLANAFRPEFAARLAHLTSLVRLVSIPVVVVGVGVQTTADGDPAPLRGVAGAVREFVSAVLDRSAAIGVRGEVTADFLRGLGFPDDAVEVIGCPSVTLHGPGFRLPPRRPWSGDATRVALSVTPGVPGLGARCRAWTARHPALEYVGQEDDDLALLLWGEERRGRDDPDLPTHVDHPLIREGRAAVAVDVRTWLEHLRRFDVAIGTRLHGTIAGLLAGTPSVLLTHDARTAELARHHALPHRASREVGATATVEELVAAYDPAPFDERYDANLATYLRFLERNGLAHAYAPEEPGPADFDRRLADAPLPPPVRPLPCGLPPELLARLQWLRHVAVGAPGSLYAHPYPFPPPDDPASRHRRHHQRLQTQAPWSGAPTDQEGPALRDPTRVAGQLDDVGARAGDLPDGEPARQLGLPQRELLLEGPGTA